jgi:hypothetical protein
MTGTLASSLLAQSIGPSPAWSACARTGSSLRGGTRQGHSAPLRDRLRRPLTEPAATGADLHQRRAAARHTFGGRTTRAHTVSIRQARQVSQTTELSDPGLKGKLQPPGTPGSPPADRLRARQRSRLAAAPTCLPGPGAAATSKPCQQPWRVTPHRPTALFTMWGIPAVAIPPGLGGGRHAEGGPPGSVLSPGGPSSKVCPPPESGDFGRRPLSGQVAGPGRPEL